MVSESPSVRTLDLGLRFVLSGGVLVLGHKTLWFELALCEHMKMKDEGRCVEVQQREDVNQQQFFSLSFWQDFFVVIACTFSVVIRALDSLSHEQLSFSVVKINTIKF